jgi:AcrR family transcriptional regulator
MAKQTNSTGTQTGGATAQRAPLNRERVLDAAIALADEGGIEALSMRRLAKELGVEAMSLYNHVASKDDLLAGITEAVLREMELPSGGDWRADLRRYAVSAHEVLNRHPWACNLALSPPRVLPVLTTRAEWVLRRLREGGFPAEVTYHAFHALDAHVLGFTLWQLGHGIRGSDDIAELAADFLRSFPADEYPYMHEHVQQHIEGFGREGRGAFELVLDLILDGLEPMRDAR